MGAATGVGVGLRPELVHGLLASPSAVDFLEVVAETANARPEWRREAVALSEVWPIVPHGVKLSLASANGIDEAHAQKLGDLARDVRATMVSEHVALTRTNKREIGHLTAVPFRRDMVSIVARNVAVARQSLPEVPLLLENPAWTLRFPDDAMHEGDFYAEIVRATGCGLLLDVANVYANARNLGVDPLAFLERHPLEHVRMLHVAGGMFEDGFFFDTHAHAVSEEVMALTARAFEACGDVPVVLERDANFPDFGETAAELATLRRMHARAGARTRGDLVPGRAPEIEDAIRRELAARQDALAAALVDDAPSPSDLDGSAIVRTRAVLREKRIDDALPLLPRLSRRRADVEPIVRPMVPSWPRPGALVGPADALRIADAVASHPALASDARLDRLLLRARFVGPSPQGEVRLRAMPFVGREGKTWAVKGPGTHAPVRWITTGGTR